ncbi:MFS transporter [Roseovarius aestuarii]|nr:MFS transporter [Roseovarius aestuarii]
MRRALFDNWALFLGMLMLMLANGLLVTLLTIRGSTLGFSPLTISVMQACYPLGALLGTIAAPRLIEKVGHIRVFSALASVVSVSAILHLLTSDPFSWSAMRFLAGVCFPGLYVVTEAWLNAKAENKLRAQILSVYFVIQLIGPALGTAMVGLPDPSGNMLFGVASILISMAIVPLLLSGNRAPDFVASDRMSVARLYRVSPMAVIGIVVTSIGVSAWFISLPLLALSLGFGEAQASGTLVIAMLVAAVVQYPVGWISDNTDRRHVVIGLGVTTALVALWLVFDPSATRIVLGFAVIAGSSLPVYSILAAHANDQLSTAQIVPASGTMAFLMQLGQLFGMLIGPNVILLAGGAGLQLLMVVTGLTVAIVAITRRLQSAAPIETGTAVATGVIGFSQPGMIQAELVAEDSTSDDKTDG